MDLKVDKNNILSSVPTNNLTDILFVSNSSPENETFEITPSQFIRELNDTTEERFNRLIRKKYFNISNDFVPNPSILIFQSFEPGKTYTLNLQVRNSCMVIKPLKWSNKESSYFTVKFADLPVTKVAPGLSIEYQVIFTPKEKKDYHHCIVFESNDDIFYVPIVAIGPRALLDIPDEIILPPAPVKVSIEKIIVIRNIGEAPAVFNFVTEGCFRVEPSKGYLGIQDIMQLSVFFESSEIGEYCGKMYVCLESGEKLTVTLYATSENVCVRLDKNSVTLDDTFIGLQSCKNVKLVNNSSSVVKYGWKKNKTLKDDLEFIERLKDKYDEIKNFETFRDMKLKYFNVTNRKKHELSWEKILEDELQLLDKEEFKFSHEAISIVPERGELWPKSYVEFTVSFEPKINQLINTDAYLEVSGRDSRLPLNIQGAGKGPLITLNIETLDIDFLYLCCAHNYEVIAINQGDIPGTIGYQSKPLIFGGNVESSPKFMYLKPREHGVFVITYSNNRQGEFTENLEFLIVESKETVKMTLKGSIISPTLHFDKNVIDFGLVPVGFPTTEQVILSNLSMVPVTYSLKVLSDGSKANMSYEQFATFTVKPPLPKNPKEFIVYPSEGIVEPYSCQKVEIALTPNSARKWGTQIVVDIWDSSCPVSCPIRFHSQIAQVTVEPNLISIPFCFVNYPYTRYVVLKNKSKVPGFFCIVPQDPNAFAPITYSPNISQGVLQPRGIFKVTLTIICSVLNRQSVPLNVLVLGLETPIEMSTICCVGQGPVVTITPSNLSWEEIHLLQEEKKDLVVVNECPIPASCTCVMKPNSPWTVTPTNFILQPEEKLNLNVKLFLRDRGKYNESLKIEILNGKTLSASLSAIGVGSSLVIEPKLCPKYDMGTVFSKKKIFVDIKITNGGTKPIGLIWSPIPDLRVFSNAKFVNPADLVFKIEPTRLDFLGGEEKSLQLEVQNSNTGFHSHTYYCFANVGNPAKELHLTSEISAEFIEPVITFDKLQLDFYYNVGFEKVEHKLIDTVTLINKSTLNIAVQMEVLNPFFIVLSDSESVQKLEITINGNENRDFKIKFNAEEQEDRFCRLYKGNLECTFKEHSKKASIVLNAELNYPNVLLLPRSIDFDCIPICTHSYQEMTLINTSPLPVQYRLQWDFSSTTLQYLESKEFYFERLESCRTVREISGREMSGVSGSIEGEQEEALYTLNGDAISSLRATSDHDLKPPVKPTARFPDIEIKIEDVKNALFPVSKNYYSCEEELMNAYKMSRLPSISNGESVADFLKLCDITPFHGKLEKFESQVLTIRFGSDVPVSLHAEALLSIRNGPTETISIDAKVSNIKFQVDRVDVDFGRQLFCETGCETIKISNTGLLPFDFETNTMDPLAYIENLDFPVESGVLIITPRSGHVPAESEMKLLVRYHPGTPGKFEESFQLRVAYLNPVTIRVTGFGVFPQIYVDLPRPGLLELPVETGYAGIASLREDWFLVEQQLPVEVVSSFLIKAYRSEETNLSSVVSQNATIDPIRKEYVFIENELVPSQIEAELSIERILAYNLIANGILFPSDFTVYARIIPNFLVPAYEIDFGIVIVEQTSARTVSILNYGPLSAVIYYTPDRHHKEEGIRVRIKNRNELKIGGTLVFTVYFLPKRNKYKNRVEELDTFIYFEVYHGAKIPIHVNGTVTYPFVEPSTQEINYGNVKCSTCKVIVLKLKNPGLVAADWCLELKLTKQDLPQIVADGLLNGVNMFSVDVVAGNLQMNESCCIQVAFQPKSNGIFGAYLYVKADGSQENQKIKLIGTGIEPALIVSHTSLSFEPTLPSSKKSENFFKIENPCPFPVELCLTNLDEQLYEEEKILRALSTYYQTDELLLPLRQPGGSLPTEIINFYEMLKEKLYTKKNLEENIDNINKSFDEKKGLKSRKAGVRPKTSVDYGLRNSKIEEETVIKVFESKPTEENEVLLDYVRELVKGEAKFDPIQETFRNLYPVSDEKNENEPEDGTLIIFHGAPYTSIIENVNREALFLKLQSYSIDRLVLEEAIAERCDAGSTARELIEKAYNDHIQPESLINLQGGETDNIDEDIEPEVDFYDKVDELQMKLNSLIKLKTQLLAPRTKESVRESPKKVEKTNPLLKPMNPNAPLAGITEDLVFEILKSRLPYEVIEGVVIESLESVWINSHLNALTYLIKAAGNIKEIYFLVVLNNYERYMKLESDRQNEEEKRNILLKENKLRMIEEGVDSEESLNLDEEEYNLLLMEYLSKRHESQDAFCRMRDERFRIRKLRREAKKKGLPLPPMPLTPKQAVIAEYLEKENQKLAPQPSKTIKTISASAKRTGTDAKSVKAKMKDPIETEFSTFEQELNDMKNLLEGWDRQLGVSINEVPETKSRRGTSSKKSVDESVDSKPKPDRGVPFWLIDYTPESKILRSVSSYLKSLLESSHSEKDLEDCALNIKEPLTFSVVHKPPSRAKAELLNMFTICPVEKISKEDVAETGSDLPNPDLNISTLKLSESQISVKVKKRSTSAVKKRKPESRMSSEVGSSKTKKSSLPPVADCQLSKTRWVLQPKESMAWKVQYYPTKLGEAMQIYSIEIPFWRCKYQVKCKGICDIPAIDMTPEKIFDNVAEWKPLNFVYPPTFFYMNNTYDFGSVIPTPTCNKRNKNSKFKLKNKSKLNADLNVVFGDKKTSNGLHFSFEPKNAILKPGETCALIVYANPTKVGPLTEELMLVVKDNPKVESIRVKCHGVKVNLSISPTIIDFGKMLLYRKGKQSVSLISNNSIALYFYLQGVENFPPQFSFSCLEGVIKPYETFLVDINYEANEVHVIADQKIDVKVCDDSLCCDPLETIPFSVNAEAYDALLDISFATLEDDHVDFGVIRVEAQYKKELNLKNVGEYLLGYKIEIDYDLLAKQGSDDFYVMPCEGKLLPGKNFPVTVSFLARNEVTWNRLTLFKIRVIEPSKSDELIALIPIEVSVKSYFATYDIQPLPDFNLGPIKIRSQKSVSLIIQNKGKFSLYYVIEQKLGLLRSVYDLEETVSKKSSKKTNETKDKVKKTATDVLKLGPFEISPASKLVEPGEAAVVQISCSPNEVKAFEENVTIFVDESPPHLKDGNDLKIMAEGCVPIINFDDYKTMFREFYISNDELEFNCPDEVGCYTLFTTKNLQLNFRNVCVGKTIEARIHLQNIGQIDCFVKANIGRKSDEKGSRSSIVSDGNNFSVIPAELIIEPYSSSFFTVTFRPDFMETYKARITMTLEVPASYEPVNRTFELNGSGCIPQVEIIEPPVLSSEGQALVTFPSITPGFSSNRVISFKNVGKIACKAILELFKFQENIFTLHPLPDTEEMLNIWDLAKPINHTTVVSLKPDEVATFKVEFSPAEVKSYSSDLKIFVVDNPFENLSYKLLGDVYFEEVIIEKISTGFDIFSACEETNKQITPGHYVLDLEHCYVKKKKKAILRLANRTEHDCFKFEWDELPNISIVPSLGHLYPKSYKDIVLTFAPQETTDLNQVPLYCHLIKICFSKEVPEPSWDSRLVQNLKVLGKEPSRVRTVSRLGLARLSYQSQELEKTDIIGKEPDFDFIPESNSALLVQITCVADYSRLVCATNNIILEDTFMFQNRTYPLVLENVGNVVLDYFLELKEVIHGTSKENINLNGDFSSNVKLDKALMRPKTSRSSKVEDSYILQKKCGKKPRPLTCESILNLNSTVKAEPSSLSISQNEESTSYNPIQLENTSGKILPKEKAICNITFSPLDVNEYKATIKLKVPNLHPDYPIPDVTLTAKSLMPYCHFDVAESDYLTSGRRDFSRPGPVGYAAGLPLGADTKAIEIKVLGVGLTVPVTFHAINPTDEDYTFSWINATQIQPGVVSSFHCNKLDGRVQSGRQQLMEFEFFSQSIGTVESFWQFSIPKYGIETLFLFVGVVREPNVYFLSNNVNMNPSLIGAPTYETLKLINHEDFPFGFSFVQDSLYSEGRLNSLIVKPLAGILQPDSEISIKISYTGKKSGKVLFNLKCKIDKFKEPFCITVETVTYSIQPLITFEDLKNVKHTVNPLEENLIDFGTELNPRHSETISLALTSTGQTSFYYEWIYDKKFLRQRSCKLKFTPAEGHITSHSRGICDLTILFTKKSSIKSFPVKLKISRGSTFNFLISGSATTPQFEFSFSNYDFGYCFIQEKEICFNEIYLIFKNKDSITLTLEGFIAESSAFGFDLLDEPVPPGCEIKIPICFSPKELISYKDEIKFTINSIYDKIITLSGSATPFKVMLLEAKDKNIFLSAVRERKKSARQFSLINKSLAPATVLIGFSDQLPVNPLCLAKPNQHPLDLNKDHRLSNVITISPSKTFVMKPKEIKIIDIEYSPTRKCSLFSETICMQYQEKLEPISRISGCCIGAEFMLDKEYLSFGAVVAGCSSTLKLKLINSGDIGGKFEWQGKGLEDEFSISPSSGYCSAGSEVTVNVTFHPRLIVSCIRKSVECKINLSPSEKYPSLFLVITGECIDLPKPVQIIKFECHVRDTNKKSVEIVNRSGNEWQLIPIITGEYFKGVEALVVPCMSSAQYEITYHPLTMTQNEIHEGSVFFKLPTGQGLLYELKGTALPPLPLEIITREVPCKTKYTELLKIKNWLQYSQRLKTSITCTTENSENSVYTCNGFENLDLPASSEKEYYLNFFAQKTGKLRFHVNFINEETGEYLWYDVTFNVIMCGPLEVITLKAGVRQTCKYEFKLENPLKDFIEYKLESTSPEIHFTEIYHKVPPNSSIYVEIIFIPIHPGEKAEKLNATCKELGLFPRDLRLIALKGQSETQRHFEAHLGSSQIQHVDVKNISHLFATLKCRTDSDEFKAVEQVSVASGQIAAVTITYEPNAIGSAKGVLYVESDQAGNFEFPLIGTCLKPLPKGPFIIRPGSGVNITFKNVLKEAKTFQMYVDNPAFTLKTTQEDIQPKNDCKIYVGLKKTKQIEGLPVNVDKGLDPRFPIMGQLVVQCFNPHIKWQFYLKGILEKGSLLNLN